MTIERATVMEHYAGSSIWQDKRTLCQKQQQKLWQQLGTLHRTKANLMNLADSANKEVDRHNLMIAVETIRIMIEGNLQQQRNLPNKKRQRDSHKETTKQQQS